MTRAAQPTAPARAAVTDMADARRRRDAKDGAPDGAPDGDAAADGGAAPAAKRRRDPANRRFDAVKVERLRREIADGAYEIDCWSVADRFIEHERNRG